MQVVTKDGLTQGDWGEKSGNQGDFLFIILTYLFSIY